MSRFTYTKVRQPTLWRRLLQRLPSPVAASRSSEDVLLPVPGSGFRSYQPISVAVKCSETNMTLPDPGATQRNPRSSVWKQLNTGVARCILFLRRLADPATLLRSLWLQALQQLTEWKHRTEPPKVAIHRSRSVAFTLAMAIANATDISYLWSLEFWAALCSKHKAISEMLSLAMIAAIIVLATVIGPSGAILAIPRPVQLSRGTSLTYLLPTDQMYPARFTRDHLSQADGSLTDVLGDNTNIRQALGDIGRQAQIAQDSDPRVLSEDLSEYFDTTVNTYYSVESKVQSSRRSCRNINSYTLRKAMPTIIGFSTPPHGANYATVSNVAVAASIPFIGLFADIPNLPWDKAVNDPDWNLDHVFLDIPHTKQPLVRVSWWSTDSLEDSGKIPDPTRNDGERLWPDGSNPFENITYGLDMNGNPPANCSAQTFSFAYPSYNHSAVIVQEVGLPTHLLLVVDAFWIETHLNSTTGSGCISTVDGVSLVSSNKTFTEQTQSLSPIILDPDFIDAFLNLTVQYLPVSPGQATPLATALALVLASWNDPFNQFLTTPDNLFGITADNGLLFDRLDTGFEANGVRPENILAIRENLTSLAKTSGVWDKYWRMFYITRQSANTTTFAPQGLSSLETLEIHHYLVGTGFSPGDIWVKLSLAALSTYCLVVIAYSLYTFITAEVGDSWSWTSELLMLALNSERPPERLGRTSVGLGTVGVFSEGVAIRADEAGEGVELVFTGEEGVGGAKRKGSGRGMLAVRDNEAY